MANLTTYTAAKLLNHLLGKEAFALPTSLYLGLFTQDPTATGALVGEVIGGGYARVDVRGVMTDADPNTGQSVNTAVITFANPTAGWGLITHAALLDAAVGGKMLTYAPFTVARQVNAGDPPVQFLQGQLVVRLH